MISPAFPILPFAGRKRFAFQTAAPQDLAAMPLKNCNLLRLLTF